jgi:hypothetical protein
MVYLVLFGGAAVLLALLLIVWLSTNGNDNEGSPPCYDITSDEARSAVQRGAVDDIEIFLDRNKPSLGPSVVRVNLNDGTCRELPKGADNVDVAYMIIGVVEVYNNTHDERVSITYHLTDVLPEFLVTSTPTPTETPVPTVTPTPSPTRTVTATVPATTSPALVPGTPAETEIASPSAE